VSGALCVVVVAVVGWVWWCVVDWADVTWDGGVQVHIHGRQRSALGSGIGICSSRSARARDGWRWPADAQSSRWRGGRAVDVWGRASVDRVVESACESMAISCLARRLQRLSRMT
jgi:hypothetical protein